MTDLTQLPSARRLQPAAQARLLKRRHAAEFRFRAYGVLAIAVAVTALVVLLWTVLSNAGGAFTKHYLTTTVPLDPARIVREDTPDRATDPEGFAAEVASNQGGFFRSLQAAFYERYPNAAERPLRTQMNGMVARLAVQPLAREVAANPDLIGQRIEVRLPVSDDVDLYLKGNVTAQRQIAGGGTVSVSDAVGTVELAAAPGTFAGLLAEVKSDLRARAALEQAGRTQDGLALSRLADDEAEAAARTSALTSATDAEVSAGAERLLARQPVRDVRLARLAGELSMGSETARAALKTELATLLSAAATTARRDAATLERNAARYDRRALQASERGDPRARGKRETATSAAVAADRREAEAAILAERATALAGAEDATVRLELAAALNFAPGDRLQLLQALAAAQAAGDLVPPPPPVEAPVPEAPEVEVAPVEAPAGPPAEAFPEPAVPLVTATRAALEQALARVLGPDVASATREAELARAQRTRLEATLAALPTTATEHREVLERVLEQLSEIATRAEENAAELNARIAGLSEMPGDELGTEAEFALGTDLGGPLEVAYTLGAQGSGDAANLRALLLAGQAAQTARLASDRESVEIRRDAREEYVAELLARADNTTGAETLDRDMASYLVSVGGMVVRVETLTSDAATGFVLIPPAPGEAMPNGANWSVLRIAEAENNRNISDAQIAWTRAMVDAGMIKSGINAELLTKADSNDPELAGALGAVVGSLLTMLVTMLLAVPVGILAAIYLEEFAPRNRLTEIIEININNLAAVPSIVFGLLGLAVFLNFLGLPRSSPLAGGLVLALMTMPTVIIAARAALKAVPPSIREAALGVGASRTQAVFQHVLPLAMPGILTGTIIGMAQALGETAPLLLMGMVAFVAEVPQGLTDSATVLPVLVFQWATRSFRAWEPMTAGAIVLLLVFMILMNALAVVLRRRFERRW
jgi:phosphate ABC transporter permease subunit PstA